MRPSRKVIRMMRSFSIATAVDQIDLHVLLDLSFRGSAEAGEDLSERRLALERGWHAVNRVGDFVPGARVPVGEELLYLLGVERRARLPPDSFVALARGSGG